MSDERLDKLGQYYVYFQIDKRYNIPFERFVQLVERNLWADLVN